MPEQEPQLPRTIDFAVTFEDGTVFELPLAWHDVFVDEFGFDHHRYPDVALRLREIAERYHAHKAWPSRYDGRFTDDDSSDRYYFQHWDDDDSDEPYDPEHPPSMADVAWRVMYQDLRVMLMQKSLQELGSHSLVMTIEQFIQEND
jgi:hypothetical protein